MRKSLFVNKGLILSSFLIISEWAAAQGNIDFTKVTDILPPPPNAASIIQAGTIAVNKNTGAPSFSIPLFTLQGKKLNTSASISYSATGIKVDEIASRVGMGWALNIGGVVTRTVRHVPDELRPRRKPWATVSTNWSTYNYMSSVVLADNVSGYDSEPDLFSFNFNGYSGSFVLDEDMSVAQVNRSNIKIEYNFNSTDWNFKFVTPDGVVYYFGGSTATEKTKREQICGKLFDTYLPNSWYLKKIEHPNGEVINFVYTSHNYTYETGTSQTMTWVGPVPIDVSGNHSCTTPNTTTCINLVSTQGVLLSSVNIPGSSSINLYYQDRDDCQDKLVSRIELKDLRNNLLRGIFEFSYSQVTANMTYADGFNPGYDKTPYLTVLTEWSADSLQSKSHKFVYNDNAGRPPRLSYSQDHWGYFNGVINASFVPKPDKSIPGGGTFMISRFPYATANREPDFKYAVKGMLSKIIYPTGGIDSIVYEPNQYYMSVPVRPLHIMESQSTGTGFKTQVVQSNSFMVDEEQEVDLVLECIDNYHDGSLDSIHHKGQIEIINSSQQIVYSQLMWPGWPGNTMHIYPQLDAGTYTLKLYANGDLVTTKATLKFYPQQSANEENVVKAGVRVGAVITGNPGPDEQPMIKKYYYGDLNALSISSLYWILNPVYIHHSEIQNVFGDSSGYIRCDVTYLYSNSLKSLYNYQSSLASYTTVVESIGENFEGGGTQTKFYAQSDGPGIVLWNEEFVQAPRTNYSNLLNGKPREEIVLKKDASGTLLPLKKTLYNYRIDSSGTKSVYGYVVNAKYGSNYTVTGFDTTSYSPESIQQLDFLLSALDMMRYEVFSSWIYTDTVTEISYDSKSENPLTTTTAYTYNNNQHLQPAQTQTSNSKGETLKTEYEYPHDYAGQAIYDSMIANNMITPVIDSKTFNDTTKLTEVKASFADWGNKNYALSTVERAIGYTALQVEGTISQYDSSGNILEYTGKDGIVNAIIWGYDHRYPVAKVAGATYNQATAALGTTISALQAMDGTALQSQLNNIRTTLTAAHVTTYTYKPLTGVATITDPNNRTSTYEYDGFNRLKLVRDQDGNILGKTDYQYASVDENAKFMVYFSKDTTKSYVCQTCQSGYTTTGVNYNVPYGKYFSLISQQDADNKAIADLDSNGQLNANKKGICYKMATYVYYNEALSDTFTRQCSTGYVGSQVIYTVPAGTYSSTVSQQAANTLAQGDIEANGQSYANANGTCTAICNSGNCSGVDKKCVNSVCETGVKIYTSSVQTGPHLWECTYHYEWSDGSWSQNYTEESAQSCSTIIGGD